LEQRSRRSAGDRAGEPARSRAEPRFRRRRAGVLAQARAGVYEPARGGRIVMSPVVAVIAPGMMGAAVGKRLVDHGIKVLTSLKGRSAETVARAKTAGMQAASDAEIAATDFILSILPPGDAVALAQRFAPA